MAAATAPRIEITTTERRPRVKVATTGGIQTTEADGWQTLVAPDGEMDAEAVAGETKWEVQEDGNRWEGWLYGIPKS
ncbi:hypothetical protein Scep_023403 [Stephania cephalantha]|uniref:Uncharacterized protein n=1 Tax=Stephania cephalantha TaxID=152367 RepID=A0AAP0HSR6_9MAGN